MLGGVKSRLAAVETASNPTEHREIDEVQGLVFKIITKIASSSFILSLVNLKLTNVSIKTVLFGQNDRILRFFGHFE